MTDYIDGSVSKGVFIFKGKKKRARTDDYASAKHSEVEGISQDVCETIWEKINDRVQILQCDLNTQMFDDLLDYIKKSSKCDADSQGSVKKHIHEIPTAALVTGVNSPDHAVMFHNLRTVLHEKITPYVSELRSKDCVNIKATVSKAVSDVMGTPVLVEDEVAEEQPNMKRISPTFSILSRWYNDRQLGSPAKNKSPKRKKSGGSPNRKPLANSSHGARPPVVFILEDLEAFSPHVLQDFITICSNHLAELPVVLVFGIATSVTVVHKLISNAASSLLCMEKFQAPPSTDYLSLVIDQVVMTADIPFKLGPKVFNLLLDMFLFNDLSVLNFVRGLQFSLLEHFYSHSHSIICHELSSAQDILAKLSDKQLKHIKELPSFQAYLEERNKKLSPLKSNRDVKKEISTLLERLNDYHQYYFPVLRCLHAFTVKLPGYPLGKRVRELYARSLSSTICDLPEYQESLQLMKSLSRDELLLLLQECYNNLNFVSKEFSDVCSKLEFYIGKFENIEELQKEADKEHKEAAEEDVVIPKKADLYTLRQTLQSMEMKKKKVSVYENLRNDLIDYMHTVFKKYLISPSSLPLHEVYYYNNASELRHHVNGSPRSTIQLALTDAYHYLQNENLKADGDTILSTLPDICIAYKLHLECGKLINLYDWLQAFMMIVSTEADETTSAKKREKHQDISEERVLQARFIRAVSELQFLGFVKPTKRKTDHVARLTWGGC